jgi:hypothetical protein
LTGEGRASLHGDRDRATNQQITERESTHIGISDVISAESPLQGKLTAAYLAARKHTALANIVGMAGRQAASAARTLSNPPTGTDAKGVETALIANARTAIVSEMAGSIAVSKASEAQVTTIVQGELDKLVVAPIAVLPVTSQPVQGPSTPPVAAEPQLVPLVPRISA